MSVRSWFAVPAGTRRETLRASRTTVTSYAKRSPPAWSAWLTRGDAEGHLVHPDLAVRVAALLVFYLSEDYARLSDEVWGEV